MGLICFKRKHSNHYNEIFLFCYNHVMSMKNKNNDEVNVIQEYKKIYDECEVTDKIKILGNIQKNQMFLHVSYPKSKNNPQKFLVSNKTFALELLYVNGYSLKKDNLLEEIDPPKIHPITNEPIKEFAEYIGKTINITNHNVDQCPEGITSYLKITNIVKLNDNRICISIQDVDKPEKLLKPFIAKDEKHLKNWFKKYYR